MAFRTVLSGVGFLCDAYDLFIMNVVLVVLGCDLATADDADNTAGVACFLSPGDKSLLATAVLVGSVRNAHHTRTHARTAAADAVERWTEVVSLTALC